MGRFVCLPMIFQLVVFPVAHTIRRGADGKKAHETIVVESRTLGKGSKGNKGSRSNQSLGSDVNHSEVVESQDVQGKESGVDKSALYSAQRHLNEDTEASLSHSSDTSTEPANFAVLRFANPYFPKELRSAFKSAKYLNRGSFGMAWLVTEKATKRQMVMKLLYKRIDERTGKYWRWKDVKESGEPHVKDSWKTSRTTEDIVEAAAECDKASQIHEEGINQAKLGQLHPGNQRVMNCFGHNIPVSMHKDRNGNHRPKFVKRSGSSKEKLRADKEPLYLLLENCGDKDLSSFIDGMAGKGQLTLGLVKNLIIQTMQGIQFLASLMYIHHDLKPGNIVVKTQVDGSYSVHLVDFGATTEVDKGLLNQSLDESFFKKSSLCKWTTGTNGYLPYEWGIPNGRDAPCGPRKHQNFAYCGSKVPVFDKHLVKDRRKKEQLWKWRVDDPSCPFKFDVFAAGGILKVLLTGYPLHRPSTTFWDHRAKKLDYEAINTTMNNPGMFKKEMKRNVRPQFPATGRIDSSTLQPLLRGMLRRKAKNRFSADDVLESPWLEDIGVPDDLDYQAALEESEIEEKIPYSVGDNVEVHSQTLLRKTGRGWTIGTVTKILGRDVEVTYQVLDEERYNLFDVDAAGIRPYVAPPEHNEAEREDSIRSVMSNFIPGKRRDEPGDFLREEFEQNRRIPMMQAKPIAKPPRGNLRVPQMKLAHGGRHGANKKKDLDWQQWHMQGREPPPFVPKKKLDLNKDRRKVLNRRDRHEPQPPPFVPKKKLDLNKEDGLRPVRNQRDRRDFVADDALQKRRDLLPPFAPKKKQEKRRRGKSDANKLKKVAKSDLIAPLLGRVPKYDELTVAECPVDCDICKPAIKHGERMTYKGQKASYCYVLQEFLKIPQDKKVTCGQPSTGWVVTYTARPDIKVDMLRFTCQDRALFRIRV